MCVLHVCLDFYVADCMSSRGWGGGRRNYMFPEIKEVLIPVKKMVVSSISRSVTAFQLLFWVFCLPSQSLFIKVLYPIDVNGPAVSPWEFPDPESRVYNTSLLIKKKSNKMWQILA